MTLQLFYDLLDFWAEHPPLFITVLAVLGIRKQCQLMVDDEPADGLSDSGDLAAFLGLMGALGIPVHTIAKPTPQELTDGV